MIPRMAMMSDPLSTEVRPQQQLPTLGRPMLILTAGGRGRGPHPKRWREEKGLNDTRCAKYARLGGGGGESDGDISFFCSYLFFILCKITCLVVWYLMRAVVAGWGFLVHFTLLVFLPTYSERRREGGSSQRKEQKEEFKFR